MKFHFLVFMLLPGAVLSSAESPTSFKPSVAAVGTPYPLKLPARFPRPALPADNPLTNEGVELGARLFHDHRLSADHQQSCASCHFEPDAFSDFRRFSRGALGDLGTRQSMPLFNLAWKSSFFWDGRTPTLRQQVLEPIQNPVEMHAKLPEVVALITAGHNYPRMFERAFGTPEVNEERVARALEQFVLTLISSDSRFDQSIEGKAPLSAEEQRGYELFNTEFDPANGKRGADCFHCHGGPLFKSASFSNNGLDTEHRDAGRFLATGLEADRGKFAVPSLRNIGRTAPYMHDGRFSTLEQVIEHYDHGVRTSPSLDPILAKRPAEGLQLSSEDKRALVAFLECLSDDSFPAIPIPHPPDFREGPREDPDHPPPHPPRFGREFAGPPPRHFDRPPPGTMRREPGS